MFDNVLRDSIANCSDSLTPYAQHQPLNRQFERCAREGVQLCISQLANRVGAGAFALWPLRELIAANLLPTQPLHRDNPPGADAGQRRHRHRACLGLRQRRCTIRETGPAGAAVPILAQPLGCTSGGACTRICRDSSGRPLFGPTVLRCSSDYCPNSLFRRSMRGTVPLCDSPPSGVSVSVAAAMGIPSIREC